MVVILGPFLVGLAMVGLLGLGRLAFRRHAEGDGFPGGPAALALLVGGGIVVLIVALPVALFALRGGSGEGKPPAEGPAAPPGTVTTSAKEPSPTTSLAPGVDDTGAPAPPSPSGAAALGPIVRMSAEDLEAETFPRSFEAMGGLEPNTVLRMRVEGFAAFAEARARQCVTAIRTTCGNAIDVQFGVEGTASFQYLVVDDFVVATLQGRCRARAAPCSIVVGEGDGERRAEIRTVFHDELVPPGRIHVTPDTGLVDGQTVTVEVENYPPGAEVHGTLCAAPDATGTERCGPPGPTASMTVGPDGTASTTLTIRSGPVGRERAFCGRGEVCGVSVTSETVFARAPVVPITFAGPPGADYDPTRLGAGLGAAAFLLGLATWLVRRTDWSPIGEEAAPEIDDAEYADLDALVASLPPEDDLDE